MGSEEQERLGRESAESLPEGPSREELASACDVMSALVKTAKGLRMYLPNNPTLIKFVGELSSRLAAHLTLHGELNLEVYPFSLRYRGSEVYQNQDPKESMAFRLHADGIRILQFSPGVSEGELSEFLEIVGSEQLRDTDDDIVTRLWGRSLPHITYLLQEDLASLDGMEMEAPAASQQDALSEIFGALASTPLAPPREVPRQMLVLTAEEAAWLREAVQADARINPLDDVVAIVSAILAGAQDPETFGAFSAIVVKLASDLLLAGEFAQASRLVRFMDRLQKLPSLPAERQRRIAALLAEILSEEVLQALQQAIDGDSVSQEQVRELLLILGLPSIGSICELLGRVEKLKMRKAVVDVLIQLGKGDPQVFAPFLTDQRWYLVRNIVLVLSLLGDPVALKMIVDLISHKEPRVRKEVLGFLEQSADPKAKPYLLKFLRDPSSSLRIRTLQILARDRLRFALKPVLALAAGDEFKARELAEKKAVYETLGELGGEQLVPMFRAMLLKKQWFRRASSREGAILAVAGLLKVKRGSALALLEEARLQGNPELRTIIEQACEGTAVETKKTAA